MGVHKLFFFLNKNMPYEGNIILLLVMFPVLLGSTAALETCTTQSFVGPTFYSRVTYSDSPKLLIYLSPQVGPTHLSWSRADLLGQSA